MDSKELAYQIAQKIVDLKGFKIKLYDLRSISSYSNFALIASVNSSRQSKAIFEKIHRELKESDKIKPLGVEGIETGEWILMDYNDVIVHLFTDDKRIYYDLDRLWKEQPSETIHTPGSENNIIHLNG
ncbi:ribosome silencing factor [bacterium]|nr:ribosome silencing factor [bacterium]